MQLDLSNNHYELFEIDVTFDVDVAMLSSHYQQLQRVLHPDKFAQGTDAERRWSVQAASRVNDAYQTLKNPLKRASYILELQGLMLNEETDTQMDPMFLMEQMELREALDEAESADDPYASIDKLVAQLGSQISEHSAAFADASREAQWPEARKLVRQWQFLEKLKHEARQLEARLDDAEV